MVISLIYTPPFLSFSHSVVQSHYLTQEDDQILE